MTLALFDLDNTLIAGDSDYLWGTFLVEKGLVDAAMYEAKNMAFYDDYKSGQLDIEAYLEFALAPLTQFSADELANLHAQFFTEKIQPIWLTKAEALVREHEAKGHILVVITATNQFITGPIVDRFDIPNLIASEGEIVDGRYTGKVSQIPCYREGKITRLEQWMLNTEHTLKGSYFYSDSFNDIPLLEKVSNPVAVDPDETLEKYALDQNIPIISLR